MSVCSIDPNFDLLEAAIRVAWRYDIGALFIVALIITIIDLGPILKWIVRGLFVAGIVLAALLAAIPLLPEDYIDQAVFYLFFASLLTAVSAFCVLLACALSLHNEEKRNTEHKVADDA
jgi:hypothetical protein